ncbi:hypothetical protein LCGC14_0484890 [marine sediment metagenome]|uniref:Uncharacterized protein n=1 Tax=marine sediment metagenome TaxID=412755 RepID=A0A0F9UVB3_9ZZZZ
MSKFRKVAVLSLLLTFLLLVSVSSVSALLENVTRAHGVTLSGTVSNGNYVGVKIELNNDTLTFVAIIKKDTGTATNGLIINTTSTPVVIANATYNASGVAVFDVPVTLVKGEAYCLVSHSQGASHDRSFAASGNLPVDSTDFNWTNGCDGTTVASIIDGDSFFHAIEAATIQIEGPDPGNVQPTIEFINLTSGNGGGENSAPRETNDSTPTFVINTDVDANCRLSVANQNYTNMGGSRDFSGGDGTKNHTGTLIAADLLGIGNGSNVFFGCVNIADTGNQSAISTSGAVVVDVLGWPQVNLSIAAGTFNGMPINASGNYSHPNGFGEGSSSFRWFVNDLVVHNGVSTDISIPRILLPGNFTTGDLVIYEYNATDVKTVRNITNSSQVTIQSTIPQFSLVAVNATVNTTTGRDVNWSTTITTPTDLSFCWFTHNDSGSFVNETVRPCNTPEVFNQTITVTASVLSKVCGFFGANSTGNENNQSPQSCFIVADLNSPQFSASSNNASTTTLNDVVQFRVNITDDISLATWTFGVNLTGTFVNDTTTSISGQTAINLTINKTSRVSNTNVCGRFYFNDSFGNENQSETCYTDPSGNVTTILYNNFNYSIIADSRGVGANTTHTCAIDDSSAINCFNRIGVNILNFNLEPAGVERDFDMNTSHFFAGYTGFISSFREAGTLITNFSVPTDTGGIGFNGSHFLYATDSVDTVFRLFDIPGTIIRNSTSWAGSVGDPGGIGWDSSRQQWMMIDKSTELVLFFDTKLNITGESFDISTVGAISFEDITHVTIQEQEIYYMQGTTAGGSRIWEFSGPPPLNFTTVVNNATATTTTGDSVNWTVTIGSTTELSFCWFTHNDSGTFTNLTVESCTTPHLMNENITISASEASQVCGFFGANTTTNIHTQTANSCFIVDDASSPVSSAVSNNASLVVPNSVVQFRINLSDPTLSTWTFGFNITGSFSNDSTVSVSEVAVNITVNKTNDKSNINVCGRFYFNDSFGNEGQAETCYTEFSTVNITAFNGLDNTTIQTITTNLDGTVLSTTTGRVKYQRPEGNFSLSVSSTGFSDLNTTINVSTTNIAFNVSLFPFPNSISIKIFKESDGLLISFQPVEVELLGTFQDQNFSTTTGIMFLGNLSADNYRLDISSTGFTTRSYFVALAANTHRNLDARLLNISLANVEEKTFTVQDQSGRLLEDTVITVAKRFNASFLPVAQKTTDISGQAVFTLDSTVIYEFTLTQTGFTTRQFQLTPSQASYTIVLQQLGQTNFTVIADRVTYATTPPSGILQPNIQGFTFSTSSPEGSIEFFSLNVSVGNGTTAIHNFTNISSSPTGGTITLLLNLTSQEGETVTGNYIIKTSDFNTVFFNSTWYVATNITPGNFSAVSIAERFGGEFSPAVKGLIVTGGATVAAITVGVYAGALGGGLAGVAMIGAFAALGFISVLTSGIIFLVAAAMYLFLGRRGAE